MSYFDISSRQDVLLKPPGKLVMTKGHFFDRVFVSVILVFEGDVRLCYLLDTMCRDGYFVSISSEILDNLRWLLHLARPTLCTLLMYMMYCSISSCVIDSTSL
jgi:hypothetical protein